MEICKEKLGEYLQADKQRKGEILDSVCEVTGLKRNSAVLKFKRLQLRTVEWSDGRGRSVLYNREVDIALYELWRLSTRLCGELLHSQRNKGQGNTLKSTQNIAELLPFPLLGLHPDNGSEFIN